MQKRGRNNKIKKLSRGLDGTSTSKKEIVPHNPKILFDEEVDMKIQAKNLGWLT